MKKTAARDCHGNRVVRIIIEHTDLRNLTSLDVLHIFPLIS